MAARETPQRSRAAAAAPPAPGFRSDLPLVARDVPRVFSRASAASGMMSTEENVAFLPATHAFSGMHRITTVKSEFSLNRGSPFAVDVPPTPRSKAPRSRHAEVEISVDVTRVGGAHRRTLATCVRRRRSDASYTGLARRGPVRLRGPWKYIPELPWSLGWWAGRGTKNDRNTYVTAKPQAIGRLVASDCLAGAF
jgi:hypothetical protein